ncbi:MAG: CBS domain-containing protein [Betaproteobacteria bacterium]|nr:CBS domain-containing protein [Betaproteobacteria bacterium]
MRNYHPLIEQPLSGQVFIARPAPPKSIAPESPALDAMTDLRHTHSALVEPQTSVDAAHAYMVQRGVRLLLVMSEERNLAGIISAPDILGEKLLRFSQEHRVKHSEILVSDIMTPLDKLGAIPIADVKLAKVGEVIASLRHSGRQHALVMETGAHGMTDICGIFSLTQIERQLGMMIPSSGVATTFAEIEATLLSS